MNEVINTVHVSYYQPVTAAPHMMLQFRNYFTVTTHEIISPTGSRSSVAAVTLVWLLGERVMSA